MFWGTYPHFHILLALSWSTGDQRRRISHPAPRKMKGEWVITWKYKSSEYTFSFWDMSSSVCLKNKQKTHKALWDSQVKALIVLQQNPRGCLVSLQGTGSPSCMGEAYVVHDPDSFQSETVGSLPVHWEPGGTSSPQVIGDGCGFGLPHWAQCVQRALPLGEHGKC